MELDAEYYQRLLPGLPAEWYSCLEKFSNMTDEEREEIRQELIASGKIPVAHSNASPVDSANSVPEQ